MNNEYKTITGPDFWQNHSNLWRESGLTQQAYCEQSGLNFPSFVYQHNRISKKEKKLSMSFVEAKPRAVNGNINTTGIQLLLPNGVKIGISNDTNIQLLRNVIDIAKDIKC